MYPILFNYKIITIGTYGLLLGSAFYLAFLLMEREFKIHGKDPDLAYTLLIAIIPSAIIGAKIFHIFDNISEFFKDPAGMIFSGAGLSVYGGFLLSFAVAAVIIRKNGERILNIFDIASPAMALGYGIGRLGCHASGDGCFGITTDTIFGVSYPNGLVPVSNNVYPAPLFESFFSFGFFLVLLHLRKKGFKEGTVFFIYLIMNGASRFFVEFIRRNPPAMLGLTQAQIISLAFMAAGAAGIFYTMKKNNVQAAQ